MDKLFEFSSQIQKTSKQLVDQIKASFSTIGLCLLSLIPTQVSAIKQPLVPGQNPPEKLPPILSNLQPLVSPQESPLPPFKRIGFAIVGLGDLSINEILPAFGETKLAKLTALMTSDPEGKGQRLALEYGLSKKDVYNYDEWERLRQNPDVDVIYIVTPNELHKEQVIQGAKIGKHILCEKPMSTNIKDSIEMIEACKNAKVKLMVAYRCRYEPHHLALKEIVKSKELGALKMIEAHNSQLQGDPQQWRLNKHLAGGGALPDIGIYCLNFARFMTCEEPNEVSSWVWSPPNDPRFKEVEAHVAWQMRFPSGVVARLATSYDIYLARVARLYFEKGVVELQNAFAYQGLRLKVTHLSTTDPTVNIEEERIISPKNQFATEIDQMAADILSNQKSQTPGEEGLQDQRIMDAIYQSANENHPIKL